jgi:hypothetical protein
MRTTHIHTYETAEVGAQEHMTGGGEITYMSYTTKGELLE